MTVRVRFAPSPTGYLHIGGARTALFNWMFARKHGGKFILRIEDTDRSRFQPYALEDMMRSLRWLGLDWDEGPEVGGEYGPYIQSERTELYQKSAYWLLEHGYAYKDFTSAEELEALREQQKEHKESQGYDRRDRNLSAEQSAEKEAAGIPFTLRFKAPLEGQTTFYDEIRGNITFDNSQIQDQILLKSDGFPTYHLANVVDDHFMQITHIMRAEEWISSAPLHCQLYAAFGWEMPKIAHLPVILSPSGKGKLSKRDLAFQEDNLTILVQVRDYIEAGYLPEAVANFLANVGWSFGDDVEKFTMAEALPRFELRDINPAPTKLPFSKLEWLNGQYIQEIDSAELAAAITPILQNEGWDFDATALPLAMPALKVRLKKFSDALTFMQFLDDTRWVVDPAQLSHKKITPTLLLEALQQLQQLIDSAEAPYHYDFLSQSITTIGEQTNDQRKAGPFLGILRYGVTGQTVSPPLFESMLLLGRERTLQRIGRIITLCSPS